MPFEFLYSSLEGMVDDPRKINLLIDYITLGRNNEQIFVIHFVRAMQALKPDSLTRAPRASSPDLMVHQSSVDQSMHHMDGATLDQMLSGLPESIPNVISNPVMKKVADHLDSNSSDLTKLDTAFPSAKMMTIKIDLGRTGEVQVCDKKEFEAYLKNLKVSSGTDKREKPLLESAQINVLFDLYAVELPSAQPPAPPAP